MAVEMAQYVKALATKTEGLSLNSGSHDVEEGKTNSPDLLSGIHLHALVHVHTYKNK